MKDFSLGGLKGDLESALPKYLKDSKVIHNSFVLAFEAHDGQFRTTRSGSTDRVPYIVHPVGVAKNSVALWGEGELSDSLETIICSALTHDVLEDSTVNYKTLASKTSERCAELVLALTKPQVSPGSTRADRNQTFFEQIRSAGDAAVYLKACDALHNLSRPQTMPTSLLKKTIIKVTEYYLPLLEGKAFKGRFVKLFSTSLQKASESLANRSQETKQEEFVSSDDFIQRCLEATDEKVMEVHDIISFLRSFAGVIGCFHGDPLEVIRTETSWETERSWEAIRDELSTEGAMEFSDVCRLNNSADAVVTRLVTISFTESYPQQKSTLPLVVMLDHSVGAKKLTFQTLKAGVAILSQKYLAAQARELLNLGAYLQQSHLELSADQANSFNLTFSEVKELSMLMDAAHYVLENLEKEIRQNLRDSLGEHKFERFESRVKSPISILQKMSSRKLSQPERLDDLIGLRIVFFTPESREMFGAVLEETFHQPDPDLPFSLVAESFQIENVCSSLGYKATHARFALASPNKYFEPLGCEIQLRTLFEDCWARVSENLVYKRDSISERKGKDLLNQLSRIRDEADSLIEDSLKWID